VQFNTDRILFHIFIVIFEFRRQVIHATKAM